MGNTNRNWLLAAATVMLASAGATPDAPEATALTPAAPDPAPPAAIAEPVAADTLSVPEPQFTPDGVAALEARMAQFVADGDVAGIDTLLVQGDQVISRSMAGIRKAETGAPITEDTIYRIYSMTKPVTGVAMMMLYEEGAFALDDPITDYFPEFEALQVYTGPGEDGAPGFVPVSRPATMGELMSHQAGFAYGLFGDDPANTGMRETQVFASEDLDTFIDKVAGIPLLFQPGDAWYYSVAVDIQGAFIERATGMTLGEFFDTRIFTPLGMVDTGFHVPEEDYDRFSDVWGYHPETGAFGPVLGVPGVMFKAETVAMESGGGGLVSTMDDYARFAAMLLNEGELDGVRLLEPETVELMRTNVLPDGVVVNTTGNMTETEEVTQRFALNFGVYENTAENGLPMGEGTYYWGGAAGTWFWVDPVNDLYFIGMIQRFRQNGPLVDFWGVSAEHLYGAMEEPAGETVAQKPAEDPA
ncbi:MAG: serine hydrolase domain-containing protein [Pseudomonadota bacterium]